MPVISAVEDAALIDLLVVGAGAAGLTTAIFAARHAPGLDIRCVDGARTIGAKILVSGGSRCNVTNRTVGERDFWGGPPRVIRNVLRAYPAARAADFFREIGVPLHEEEDGKLFPDSNRSRTVLDALLAEAARCGVAIHGSSRVDAISRPGEGFTIALAGNGELRARAIVLATGGRSLPRSGSDGHGYQLARALGHGYVETTPALAPLLLHGALHARLSGVALPAALSLYVNDERRVRLDGPMLWTHFGASGPLVLNLSRHWHRARLDGAAPLVMLSVLPADTFDTVEAWLLDQERTRPRARIGTVLATRLPAAMADAWPAALGIDPERTLAHMTRDERRRLVHALTAMPLEVRDSRGYNYAEVTAGGIPLDEIEPSTMESRMCPGLYFAGEILDVDGRLGGFNFQWSWSSAWVAGAAAAARLRQAPSATATSRIARPQAGHDPHRTVSSEEE